VCVCVCLVTALSPTYFQHQLCNELIRYIIRYIMFVVQGQNILDPSHLCKLTQIMEKFKTILDTFFHHWQVDTLLAQQRVGIAWTRFLRSVKRRSY
jgi:hypothetical protein